MSISILKLIFQNISLKIQKVGKVIKSLKFVETQIILSHTEPEVTLKFL